MGLNVRKNAGKRGAPMKQAGSSEALAQPLVGARTLSVASFVCGACVMVLEMAGSRVVAPYLGTSLIVWTSLIGIIMASLSLGYWAGGVVSDRNPRPAPLAKIIAAAAAATVLLAVAANPLLRALATSLRNVYLASVVASICLFALPSFLLGMVSPFIVRLAIQNMGSAGSTVGRFSALSSAGSILGTFLGGFVLISFLASQTILFLVAAVLAAVALMLYRPSRKAVLPLAVVALGFGVLSEMGEMPMKLDGTQIDTRYNTIRIVDLDRTGFGTWRPIRMLQTDPMGAQSLMYLDAPNELYSDYTKFYDLAFHYKPDAKRVLMLGGGGYCVPKHLGATRPDVELDIVELDPGITAAARTYFELKDRPGQRVFHEDARMFLNREANGDGAKYDAVFGDVFGSSYSIPFHLTTAECMQRIRDLLKPDGVFVVNIIAAIDGELFGGIYASVAAAFPRVLIFPATYPNSDSIKQNVMIVALADAATPDREAENAWVAALLKHRWTKPYAPRVAAFTDAFAPVEKYSLIP